MAAVTGNLKHASGSVGVLDDVLDEIGPITGYDNPALKGTSKAQAIEDLLADPGEGLDSIFSLERTKATQDAAARGLTNSTMAETASQAAMLDVAGEIAGADSDYWKELQGGRESHAQELESFGYESSADLQRQYVDTIADVQSEFAGYINDIMVSPDIAAENKALMVADLDGLMRGQIAYLNDVYTAIPALQPDFTSGGYGGAGETTGLFSAAEPIALSSLPATAEAPASLPPATTTTAAPVVAETVAAPAVAAPVATAPAPVATAPAAVARTPQDLIAGLEHPGLNNPGWSGWDGGYDGAN